MSSHPLVESFCKGQSKTWVIRNFILAQQAIEISQKGKINQKKQPKGLLELNI